MYNSFFKRLLDIIVALVFLPFIFLLCVFCALLIYIEDRGSIFYLSERLGRKGRVYRMYKLRTMRMNSPDIRNEDGSTFNSDKDPRLTKVGKFLRKTSLDELPQIINVFIGEMSFVGPRPDLPEHKEMYVGNEIEKLDSRPGITGYSQAYFRNTIPWRERIQNDIFYNKNISFFFDVRIIVATAVSVLARKNIYIKDKDEKA